VFSWISRYSFKHVKFGYNADRFEHQRAHSEHSGVLAAYNHEDYLTKRTRMIQEWADYLDGLLINYLQSKRNYKISVPTHQTFG
jgi:hypothetical protein